MLKKSVLGFLIFVQIMMFCVLQQSIVAAAARQMENLDRGVVAVKVSNGVFVSWRVLGTEASDVTYNLYRGSTKVATITESSNYIDTAGTTSSTYSVSAVVGGTEQAKSAAVNVWGSNYLSVPLQIPEGGATPDGVAYTYSANDCSVGDLDGDGQYEIILKWDPSNAKDNSQSGYTGNVYLDAYKMNGTRLWRIDLGKNIRAGAHYTQFMVYDLDGDGKAEISCKTADGTKDGVGTVIGSATSDYRNSSGYILSGPEYLTVFQGATGKALYTTNYEPSRGTVSSWGDNYGNRVDRFLACIAYLDGIHPSLVMCRGYYTRSVLEAYDWNGSTLTKRWTFDSNTSGNSGYAGQGNHNLSVADVDNDGKDEIIYGSATIDDTGKGLYTTNLRHGDSMHLGDLNPNRPGLEVWACHEDTEGNGSIGASFRDARTGSILWSFKASKDTGRACSADLTASYPGEEVWAAGSPLYSCTGQNIGTAPGQNNFAIWWDGDELRELLDGTTISKYGGGTLLSASGCASNNGTKSTPCLQADLLGDWREEVIFRTSDNAYLRIYTTTNTTNRRIYTLMHDPVYRLGIAWQNVAYNQPPHTSFFLGNGMAAPPVPEIDLVGDKPTPIPGGSLYQAEDAVYGGSIISESTNSGYYGTGYINFPISGGYLEFQNVDGGTGGAVILKFRNSLGTDSSRTGRIQVNGGTWQDITFDPTGAWTTWSVKEVNATLDIGTANTIRLESTGQDLANIDELDITVPVVKKGDVNQDGDVNALDFALVKKHILGSEFLTGDALKAADVDGSGTVDALDYSQMKKYLLGLITGF
ncbi:MAG: rhamnogalacturonan lyase family protein [Ruminiclostridium sp.]